MYVPPLPKFPEQDILVASALHDEDVLVAYRRLWAVSAFPTKWRFSALHTDFHRRLAICKFLQVNLRRLLPQTVADAIHEERMARAAEDLTASHRRGWSG